MTNEIVLPDKSWIAVRESALPMPRPFEKAVELGTFAVLGLEHVTDPAVRFGQVQVGSELRLLCREENVSVLNAGDELGFLPVREGRVLARLLAGGKKLAAKLTEKDLSRIFPKLSVTVTLEDF